MSDSDLPLFSQLKESPSSTRKPVSVFEITREIQSTLEPAFRKIWVKGEVSNFRPAASGHVYFSLKDERASLSSAIFSWGKKKPGLGWEVRDGMEVVCEGKISVYAPRGTYQMIVDHIEPVGAGSLQLQFEQLKAKLYQEGLFDPDHKTALPVRPQKIAVVTSPSGAAIQDILQVLGRRAPNVEVCIVPAVVQGAGASAQIISALETAETQGLGDVILLTRGGGSIEDLWCFNDEALARCIYSLKTPVVSGVGHEIDFTIADFVADLRAPTPSAAAEIVSQGWVGISEQINEYEARLHQFIRHRVLISQKELEKTSARLRSPRDLVRERAQRCDEWAIRMHRAVSQQVERSRSKLEQASARLEALSPLQVLERGYSIIRDPQKKGKVVKSAQALYTGGEFEVTLADGRRSVKAL